MNLSQFVALWQEDGTRLVEQQRRRINGAIWLLYAVYFPQSTYEYGRHSALILKVNAKGGKILMHDFHNLSGEVDLNWRQGIDEWFEEHAGKY